MHLITRSIRSRRSVKGNIVATQIEETRRTNNVRVFRRARMLSLSGETDQRQGQNKKLNGRKSDADKKSERSEAPRRCLDEDHILSAPEENQPIFSNHVGPKRQKYGN